jgi:hypothetical protein
MFAIAPITALTDGVLIRGLDGALIALIGVFTGVFVPGALTDAADCGVSGESGWVLAIRESPAG